MKKYVNSIFGNPVLEKTNIKIGFHNRRSDYYENEFFQITSDIGVVAKEIEEAVSKREGCDIYIAPVSYSIASGAKDNVAYVMALVADFDTFNGEMIKNMPEEEAERCRKEMIVTLQSQAPKPSIIVKSGNGLQVYWYLKKPLMVENNVTAIENVQKALANLPGKFKGDLAAAVLGHTVRLPGTKNFKDPDNIKECKVIWEDESVSYAFETLVEELNVSVLEFEAITTTSEGMYQTYKSLNVGYDDFRKAAGQCEFFRYMSTTPEHQSYSLWTHGGLNLAVFGEDGRIAFHSISKKHPTYHFEESERHFSSLEEKVKDSGYKSTSCATICEAGFTCSKSCQQKSPAGMILSTLMKAKKQKLSVEVDLEAELERIVPKLSSIDNMRLIEAFITDKLNASRETKQIKIAYLKEAMKILGIPERGNLKALATMIKVVSFKGGTGNFEVDLGDQILTEKDFICVAGNLMIYDQGIWRKYQGNIRQDIINRLQGNYVKRVAESIEFYIKNKSSKPLEDMNNHSAKNLICLSNGMLQMDAKGDFQLLEHRKEYFALNCLDLDFDPAATCPRFLEFLNECFSLLSKKDRKVTIEALQEWFGYTLVTGNEFHRFALIIGKTRAGKSVVQEVLTDLLGSSNVSNISISILDQPINTINLFDKLINIGPEFGASTRFNLEFLKSLTGGDGVSGRDHRKAPVSFKNGAKMMFASNEFPTILDSSGALYARALCFPFDNTVPEEKRNINLSDELKRERAGILLWALQGRARLLKRGRFIESAAMLALKDKVKISNDSVLSWFYVEKSNFDRTVPYYTIKSWWDAYKNFCYEEGMKPLKRSKFIEGIKKIPGTSISKPSTLNQECIICDWTLVDPPEMENNKEEDFVSEALQVTEMNKRTVPQGILCPPVVEATNEGADGVEETNIVAMVQAQILDQDEEWNAFN